MIPRVLVALLALLVLLDAATVYLILASTGQPAAAVATSVQDIVHGLFLAAIGYLIASRRPKLAIGWLMIVIALAVTLGYAARVSWRYAAEVRPDLVPDAVLWFGWVLVNLSVHIELIVLSSFFPYGPQGSRPRRIALAAQIAVVALGMGARSFTPGPLSPSAFGIANPMGIAALAPLSGALESGGNPAYLFLLVSAVVLLASRYVKGSTTVRQQIKWLTLALAVVVATVIVGYPIAGGQGWAVIPYHLAFAVLPPAAIGIAILRYQLFDIDLVINRTVVYGSVTAILAGAFAGLSTAAQYFLRTLTGQESAIVSIGFAILVVAAFTPLKTRVQAVVDRRFKKPNSKAPATLATAK